MLAILDLSWGLNLWPRVVNFTILVEASKFIKSYYYHPLFLQDVHIAYKKDNFEDIVHFYSMTYTASSWGLNLHLNTSEQPVSD